MIRAFAAASLVVLALAAGAAGASTQRTVLKITTAPGTAMRYSTTTLKARAGVVTIVMKNTQAIRHDVAIERNGFSVKGKLVGKGGTSIVSAQLKRGRYTFYCSVPGHEQAGMKGTLIVR